MKITTSIEKLAEPIGFDIANSSDQVQADLLNGLARGLSTLSDYDLNMQITYLTQYLTPQAKELIKTLNEHVTEL